MAILDKRNEFADALTVAHAAGTVLLGDQIDLQATGIDLGESSDLWFVITVDTAVVTAGAAGTIQFLLVSDAQAAIAVDGSATQHWASKAFVTDDAGYDLIAGYTIKVKLPAALPAYERYLGVLYVVATTTTSAGKVNAFLTEDFGRIKHYADAQN